MPTRAGFNISGTFSGDSTLMASGTPGIYVQNLTGDGDDNAFGSFTPTSQSTVDFSAPPKIVISDVMFTETFSNGTFFGTGTASGKGTATVTLDYIITGGTGFFAGAMGEVTINGTITQTGPATESFSGTYTGSLTAVPEPSSLALSATAAVAVSLLRRRRKPAG